jgi:outer membrane protein assembly factor BamE
MWSFRHCRLPGILFLFLTLSACSSVPRIVTEYRIDVQQGNVVTQDMVSHLKVGLTKDQVRFVLGTPLLTDMFHADRWDYVYRLEKGGSGEVEQRRLTVFFDQDGKLARVGGDVVAAQPAGAADTAAGASPTPESKMRVIDLGVIPEGAEAPPLEEKGFLGRMRDKVGL